jgi:hypothetical protein
MIPGLTEIFRRLHVAGQGDCGQNYFCLALGT